MKKIYFIILFFVVLFVSNATDYRNSFEKLKDEEKKIIIRVNNYFNKIKTFKSNFIQFDKNNSNMAEGVFYIKKPDKLRFEYNIPHKSLLVVNGNIVNYHDLELNEVTTVSKSSIAVFDFLSKQQNLEQTNSKIISVKKKENKYFIETAMLIDKEKNNIVYVFDEKIENFIGLNYNNKQENIEIGFTKSEENVELKNNLFVFKNPRLYKKKK